MRYIIVIRADLATRANRAAAKVDTAGAVRAYWCSWLLGAQRAQAIRDRLREEGATVAETTPIPPGGTPASNRFGVFNAEDWTPDEVLAVVGLQRPPDTL